MLLETRLATPDNKGKGNVKATNDNINVNPVPSTTVTGTGNAQGKPKAKPKLKLMPPPTFTPAPAPTSPVPAISIPAFVPPFSLCLCMFNLLFPSILYSLPLSLLWYLCPVLLYHVGSCTCHHLLKPIFPLPTHAFAIYILCPYSNSIVFMWCAYMISHRSHCSDIVSVYGGPWSILVLLSSCIIA